MSATPRSDRNPVSSTVRTTTERPDTIKRFHFESMTVGDFSDALSALIKSGRISADEASDLFITCLPPTGTASEEEKRAMAAGISYDWLKEVAAFARPVGRHEEADRHERVLKILQELDGTPRGVDTQA